jgi:hypothetical protein
LAQSQNGLTPLSEGHTHDRAKVLLNAKLGQNQLPAASASSRMKQLIPNQSVCF